jgi:2-methylisocitrate lyase-like PEP mutase family enzyme
LREDLAIERGERFAEAGADCLFVPGVTDPDVVQRLVARSPLPLNILLGAGRGPTPRELGRLGVRRVSVGGALAGVAHRATRQATEALLAGTDEALRTAIPHAEMEALLTRPGSSRPGS